MVVAQFRNIRRLGLLRVSLQHLLLLYETLNYRVHTDAALFQLHR